MRLLCMSVSEHFDVNNHATHSLEASETGILLLSRSSFKRATNSCKRRSFNSAMDCLRFLAPSITPRGSYSEDMIRQNVYSVQSRWTGRGWWASRDAWATSQRVSFWFCRMRLEVSKCWVCGLMIDLAISRLLRWGRLRRGLYLMFLCLSEGLRDITVLTRQSEGVVRRWSTSVFDGWEGLSTGLGVVVVEGCTRVHIELGGGSRRNY